MDGAFRSDQLHIAMKTTEVRIRQISQQEKRQQVGQIWFDLLKNVWRKSSTQDGTLQQLSTTDMTLKLPKIIINLFIYSYCLGFTLAQ